MGRHSLEAMVESFNDMGFSRRSVLEWHVLYNHYPQPPYSVVDIAEKAIELASNEEWDVMINFSDFDSKFGDKRMRVGDIIRQLHLEEFLDEQ